ncbi:DUF1336 domain-containing protein [Chloropicon primus]|nr:DUF1336 domain-containing protein [Chloropicon primus]
MGNKCGRHAEVRTLSRRNSRQDLGPLEAHQIHKSKKKRRKKKRKGKWRLRKSKGKSSGKGASNLPPDLTNGAAWRIRTFSESSIQSADYLSAEEDEITDEEDYLDLAVEEDYASFFTFSGFGTYFSSLFLFGRGPDDGGSQASTHRGGQQNRGGAGAGGRKVGAATTWKPGFRSLSKASRQLDKHKAEGGKHLPKSVVPYEACKERDIEPEKQCWDEPKGNLFPLRGQNYLKDRVKIKMEDLRPIYELKSVDFYSSENMVGHMAQRIKLPSTEKIPEDCPITPLLVVNYQAPMYPARIFGKPFDGKTLQVVAVYALRDGFVAEEEIKQGKLHRHTLELLKDFCADVTDGAGVPTRDRLKMIPAMPNLEEWIATKTFGKAEAAILRRWQNKPMLVRPQVQYHVGPEYIEVDVNIHDYQYATRRYFHSLKHCLKHGVMDMALVLEGRSPQQLPEQVLASIRLQKIDFAAEFPPVPPLPVLDSKQAQGKNYL